jgi:dihydroorotase
MGRQVGLKALFCSISFQINIFLGNDCAPHSHQTADGTRSGQGCWQPCAKAKVNLSSSRN